MDLISVVIPFYNAQDLIQKGCASVFEQDYPEVEFLLIDDCSSDNTWQCLQELKSAHPDKNIKLYRNEQNLGAGPTRNRGLELCTGEFVYFMDADDRAEKHLLSRMHQELVKTGADFAVCAHDSFNSDTGHLKKMLLSPTLLKEKSMSNLRAQVLKFPYEPWNKLVRKSFLLNNHIVYPAIRSGQDHCWTIEMVMHAQKIAFVNEQLYHYMINAGSLSSGKHALCMFELIAFDRDCFKRNGIWEQQRPRLFHLMLDTYLNYLPRISPQQCQQMQEKLLETCNEFGMDLRKLHISWYQSFPWYKLLPKTKQDADNINSLRNRLKFKHVYFRDLQRCIDSLHD